MATEGILRELKRRRHYMKPSIKKRKKAAEAARRRRKRVRQLNERPLLLRRSSYESRPPGYFGFRLGLRSPGLHVRACYGRPDVSRNRASR